MFRSIIFIKSIHTIIFVLLSGCVGYVLYSGIMDHLSVFTWIASGLIVLEGVVLVANGWRCPLTTYAEKLGASRGAVTDILLPEWLAARVFGIFGVLSILSAILLLIRVIV